MIPSIIGVVLSAMIGSSLFKKKPYCLWIRGMNGKVWINTNPKGNSMRRCKIARAALLKEDWKDKDIMILPHGLTPPETMR